MPWWRQREWECRCEMLITFPSHYLFQIHVSTKQPVTKNCGLTETGNCLPVRHPPVCAAQVHLHPHCHELALEIPSHACHRSAVEIRPRLGAAVSEQHAAAASVWSALSVTRSHPAQQTTCQQCEITHARFIQNQQTANNTPAHNPVSIINTINVRLCVNVYFLYTFILQRVSLQKKSSGKL